MTENLSGSLLIAHPTLRDPNFRRTILFLSQHSEEDGATGFILNRPLEDAISGPADFENVPVYFGGPVEPSRLVLASLRWLEAPDGVAFRMFVGLGAEDFVEPEWRHGLRAFAGYAGWHRGQLEAEIEGESWIVVPPSPALLTIENPATAWRDFMRSSGPLMHLLSELPDDPSRN